MYCYDIEDQIIDRVDREAKNRPQTTLIDITKNRAEEDARTIVKYGRTVSMIAEIRHRDLKNYDANPDSSFYGKGSELWPIYCETLARVITELSPTRRISQLPTW